MIDGGARLNTYTIKFVKGLGYSEEDVDPSCRITIKAYDDCECFSQGIIILPIKVDLETKSMLF